MNSHAHLPALVVEPSRQVLVPVSTATSATPPCNAVHFLDLVGHNSTHKIIWKEAGLSQPIYYDEQNKGVESGTVEKKLCLTFELLINLLSLLCL